MFWQIVGKTALVLLFNTNCLSVFAGITVAFAAYLKKDDGVVVVIIGVIGVVWLVLMTNAIVYG